MNMINWFMSQGKSLKKSLSDISIPMLIIAGGKDRIVPKSVVKKVARKYESVGEFKVFEDHLHYMISEKDWEDVASHVYEWLELSS